MHDPMKMLPTITAENLVEIVRDLRADTARNLQLLDQVLAFLEQGHPLEEPQPQAGLPAWMPDQEVASDVGQDGLAQRIRRLDTPQGKPQDNLARLKATWLGRLYIHHLKQYAFFRWLASCAWRNLYPFYINHVATRLNRQKSSRWRHLAHLGEFVLKFRLTSLRILDAMPVETPEPHVIPALGEEQLGLYGESYRFPEISVARLSHGQIYGGTNLVLTQQGVVCHDLFDFERDYTSEELHGRTVIDARSGRIRWLQHDETPEHLPAAAAFVDACAANYAHWMTEVLPRIAAFCEAEAYRDIPLVVNDGLHKNILESLRLVAGPEREIIMLPIGRAISAETLYLTSVAGYVPFDQRDKKLAGHSHGKFHPGALQLIRRRVEAHLAELPARPWPRKIFLRRNSGTRRATNASELEQMLVTHGYTIVEPEKLCFLQQVQLFQAAEEVIAPTGAALANALFCRPGARVGILMARHEQMIYRYWLSMLAPLGIQVSYVLGTMVDNHEAGIHADFHVDPEHLRELLSEWQSA